jgi:hypothetical protein
MMPKTIVTPFDRRCFMRPFSVYSIVAAAMLAMVLPPAFAATDEQADPARMWECTQADGTSMYTNKERAGCKLMVLKELSVVPSLEHMPTYRPTPAAATYPDMSAYADRTARAAAGGVQQIPDWARDWHANIAWTGGSIQTEVCSLYGEWVNLVQKTRGGFFFGSDPSYGGDRSGRNQRGSSFSFYDNARYHALSRIFGTGFVPVGCQ